MTTIRPRILCVDDEPANLKLLDALLTPRGQDKIDLVLLDVMMPEINGFDVCQMIKEEEKLRHLPKYEYQDD